jgi:hypothetical protein
MKDEESLQILEIIPSTRPRKSGLRCGITRGRGPGIIRKTLFLTDEEFVSEIAKGSRGVGRVQNVDEMNPSVRRETLGPILWRF